MEETDDGLVEWRDLVMSPGKGLFSDFESEPCVSQSIDDVLSGEEGSLGVDQDQEVQNSMLDSTTITTTSTSMMTTITPSVSPAFAGSVENSMLDSKSENGLNSSCIGNGDSAGVKRGGSIAERRAAKFGFNAAKISNPRFRSSSPLPSPGVPSPYLTIPPGISPTALLCSPILVPNPQPSSTTGSFMSPPRDKGDEMLVSASRGETDVGRDDGLPSVFKPKLDLVPLGCVQAVENQVCPTSGLAQSLVAHLECQSLNLPMDTELPMEIPTEVTVDANHASLPPDSSISHNIALNHKPNMLQSGNVDGVACVQMLDKNRHSMGGDSGAYNTLNRDQKPPTSTLRTAEDGYNWRKYGQKQVKGSEYPRSYHKCTHQNCEVKKKVEHSHDGQITEIIYKGTHNHPKPQPSGKSNSSLTETSYANDARASAFKVEGGSVWRNIRTGSEDAKMGSDWRTDGGERASSTSAVTEVSDLLSTTQGKLMGVPESAGTPEFSSTLASHEDAEEDAGSFSLEDGGSNEPDAKRRRKEACFIETTLGSRAVREPRVVVQIESDVDILDDGYRWRKYGQKVVKGNPNPRSYYKCTNAGCNVRKHVERASHNLKCVITTYEGKHNHEVPAARNSSHANSGSGGLPPPGTNTQSALMLPRHSHLPKAEPYLHEPPSHFVGKMEYNNDILRPNFLGTLGDATTPLYQMKFPTLHDAVPYGPFDLGNHHPAYSSCIMPFFPELLTPLPLQLTSPASVSITNYNNPETPLSSVQTSFPGHQLEENNIELLRPKSSSSIYNHSAGLFPS